MVSIHELEQYLSHYLRLALFQEQDCFINGLQIQGTKEIKKIATAVTASHYAIEKARELQCEALLVHHGLFFKEKMQSMQGSFYKKIKQLVDSGMHLLTYHLPLDAHPSVGNSWPLAVALGWSNLKPFVLIGTEGVGVIGNGSYESPRFLYDKLCHFWNKQGIWVGPDRPISRCAFVSGKGHAFFKKSLEEGADCFITGTHDSNEWHMAYEEDAVFMTFGHHTTETLGVRLLGKHLEEVFRVESLFIEEANPF